MLRNLGKFRSRAKLQKFFLITVADFPGLIYTASSLVSVYSSKNDEQTYEKLSYKSKYFCSKLTWQDILPFLPYAHFLNIKKAVKFFQSKVA